MIDCTITENYFKEKARMTNSCKIYCYDCPLDAHFRDNKSPCYRFEQDFPKDAITIVQKWSDGHPQKTYKDDFFERFPNARKSYNECPPACRYNIYGDKGGSGCVFKSCTECWNEPMPESEAKFDEETGRGPSGK